MKKIQRPEPARAILVLCAAQFVDVLGVTELISALPHALAQLGASPAAAGPAVTAYGMCFGGLLMLGARLGARLGHQPMLRLGLATFAAGSMLAALAPAVAVLVAARCLQGVAAAFSVPAALSLLLDITRDPRARDRAMAAWSAAGGAAGASGFALGGAVTELAGWRTLFWLNVPLAAAVWIALTTTPELRGGERRAHGTCSDPRPPLDLGGAAFLTASAMALVLGASLLADAATRELGLALIGLAAAAAAGFRDRRATIPGATVFAGHPAEREPTHRNGRRVSQHRHHELDDRDRDARASATAAPEPRRRGHPTRSDEPRRSQRCGARRTAPRVAAPPGRTRLGTKNDRLRQRSARGDASRILAAAHRSRARRSRDRPGIRVRHTNRHRRTTSPARHRRRNAKHRRAARLGHRNGSTAVPLGNNHRPLTAAVRPAARLARGGNAGTRRRGSPRRPHPSPSTHSSIPPIKNTEPAPRRQRRLNSTAPSPSSLLHSRNNRQRRRVPSHRLRLLDRAKRGSVPNTPWQSESRC